MGKLLKSAVIVVALGFLTGTLISMRIQKR